ncbi:MAG TPA: sugar transferase [Candidatus Angelobacter sp.]|nr:sugar transferase [Candidatus Angelobacter sp.]
MSSTPDVYSKPHSKEAVAGIAVETSHRSPGSGDALGAVFLVSDACIILASGLLAYKLTNLLRPPAPAAATGTLVHWLGFLGCYALLTLICKAWQGLYAASILHSAQISRVRTLKSLVLSSILTVLVLFLSGQKEIPPLTLVGTMAFTFIGIFTMHEIMQRHNLKRIERGLGTQHVLIVGAGLIGQAFRNYLETHRHLGKTFRGFVDDSFSSGRDWLGKFHDLPRLLDEHFIDEVYFTPEMDRELIMEIAARGRQSGISVKVVPDLFDGLALGAGVTYIGNVPVLELSRQSTPVFQLFIKRVMDVCLASLALIVGAPVMLAAIVAIKLDSHGPAIYTAWRVGRKGRKFRCFKFRTMVADADQKKDNLRHMNQREGATFKIANDPRITRMGKILRRYSVDEWPQFFNVLKGDMSVVGPRPHPVDDFEQYQLADLRRLDVLPGITGLWQVSARHDPSFEKNVMLDLEYIQNWTIWMDLKIILKTIPEVLGGAGR